MNSTANAANYAASWTNSIVSQKGANNVGEFALNWMPPHNSQVPTYWKDMFVYDRAWQEYVNPYGTGTDRLESVDAFTRLVRSRKTTAAGHFKRARGACPTLRGRWLPDFPGRRPHGTVKAMLSAR